jgi:hypothetical protein
MPGFGDVDVKFRTDRTMQLVLDKLQAIEDRLAMHEERCEKRLSSYDRVAGSIKSRDNSASSPQSASNPGKTPLDETPQDYLPLQQSIEAAATLQRPTLGGALMDTTEYGQTAPTTFRPEELTLEVGLDNLTLPSKHTTQAHRLLDSWPGMAVFFEGVTDNQNYPMEHEIKRGSLRTYGYGEGSSEEEAQLYLGSVESPSSASNSEETTSPLPETPSVTSVQLREVKARFDPETVRELFDVYCKVIYPMHPFVDKGRLAKLTKRFIREMNPSRHRDGLREIDSPGHKLKRKRESSVSPKPDRERPDFHSHPSDYGSQVESTYDMREPKRPERNISNAIVLLVLALGEICKCTTPIPGPVPEPNKPRNPKDAKMEFDPNPSPQPSAPGRNMEVIPGLAYFAYATDILGPMVGGNEVLHAQAFLLAGLYMGQLGRVMESHAWIHNACRVCRVLVSEYV